MDNGKSRCHKCLKYEENNKFGIPDDWNFLHLYDTLAGHHYTQLTCAKCQEPKKE